MHRLACLCVVLMACGGGTGTGEATLMGPTAPTKSATATAFFEADAGGNMVRGWTIDFFEAGPGADCTDGSLKVSASLGIWTNQAADGKKVATLQTASEITIVTDNPPTIVGMFAATMGAEGVGQIRGTVDINEFHLDAKQNPDRIDGTINAGGTDDNGAAVAVTGMFSAPVCNL
jgi:hypothetical protein